MSDSADHASSRLAAASLLITESERLRRQRATDTMSIQSAHDLPPDAPRCLSYFPTGEDCLTFYMLMVISLIAVTISSVWLLGFSGEDADMDCSMTAMLNTVLAFWIRPPSIKAGNLSILQERAENTAPPLPPRHHDVNGGNELATEP